MFDMTQIESPKNKKLVVRQFVATIPKVRSQNQNPLSKPGNCLASACSYATLTTTHYTVTHA